MTPDERALIEAAVRKGLGEGIYQVAKVWAPRVIRSTTPAIDALLVARDQRIAELEAQLLHTVEALEEHAEIVPEVAEAIEWGWAALDQRGRFD